MLVEPIIDKGTAVPRVSWGVFLVVVAAIVAGASFRATMLDVAARQDKYITRRNGQHDVMERRMDALRDDYDSLCMEFAQEKASDLCGRR